MAKETWRCEWVKCGKKCGGCPHGPYWYAYWREDGRLRKRYVGKGKPPPGDDEAQGEAPPSGNRLDDIFNSRTASLGLAFEIMGLPRDANVTTIKARFKALSIELHPDRNIGKSDMPMKRLNSAYAYIRRVMDF